MAIDALFDVLRTLVLVSALWLFATWLIAAGVSVVLGGFVLVMLPATYLRDETDRPDGRRWWMPGRLGRIALGVLLVGLGALLTLPGVPGQGLFTMFLGLRLVTPSACRRLERALARRRGVLTHVNRLRARFGQPPLRPPRAA
jgi:hypothetical protein